MADGWNLPENVLENLGQSEHLRWCAFHYCMGYRSMSEKAFDERAALYREKAADGPVSFKIGKDTGNRLHACLIGWDELDDLAEREAAVTGVRKDYKKMDIDNVLMIPELLREASHE